ncbi:ubiquitin-conjugating enzyme e2 8, partial [Nannochloropsis gaditana CCMP526]
RKHAIAVETFPCSSRAWKKACGTSQFLLWIERRLLEEGQKAHDRQSVAGPFSSTWPDGGDSMHEGYGYTSDHYRIQRPQNSQDNYGRAVIRVKKELQQSELPPNCSVQPWASRKFGTKQCNADPKCSNAPVDFQKLLHWQVTMLGPRESPFEGVPLLFELEVPPSYPFKPPRVTCHSCCWHPNVCASTGQVILPIIGEDWRPTLSLSTLIFGIHLALLEANVDVAVNSAAAEAYVHHTDLYHAQAREMLKGQAVRRTSAGDKRGRTTSTLPELPSFASHPAAEAISVPSGSSASTSMDTLVSTCELDCSARKRKALNETEPPERGLEAMCIDEKFEDFHTHDSVRPDPGSGGSRALSVASFIQQEPPSMEMEEKFASRSRHTQHSKRARSFGGQGGGLGGAGESHAGFAAMAQAAGIGGQQRSRVGDLVAFNQSLPFSIVMTDGMKAPPPAS